MSAVTHINERMPARQFKTLASTPEFASPRRNEFDEFRKDILTRHRKCLNKSDVDKLVDKILCGETCFDARDVIGRGRWLQWIDDNFAASTGFGRRTAQRYIDAFEKFQQFVAEQILATAAADVTSPLNERERLHEYCKKVIADRQALRKEKAKRPRHSNESITQAHVIEAVRWLLKAIDLDPCAHSSDVPAVIGELNYKRSDNGLIDDNPWPGTSYIWPGHMGDQSAWAEKALRELENGVLTESVLCLSVDCPNLPPGLFRYPMAMTREPLVVGYLEGGEVSARTLPTRCLFFYLSAHPDLDRFAAAFSNFAVVFAPTPSAAAHCPLLLTDAMASAD